jgi:hypothetical protein
MRFRYWVVATVLMLSIGWPPRGAASACPSDPVSSVSVTSDDGVPLLSVKARAVPLQALLSEVARAAGFQVAGSDGIGRTVSLEFTRLPLDRALRRLLSEENFVLVHPNPAVGGSSTIQLVILPGSGTSWQDDRLAARGAVLSCGSAALASSDEPALVTREEDRTFNPDIPLEQVLLLSANQDPIMRTAAIEALTLHNEDERVRRALMGNIWDPDPNTRSLALGLLGPLITSWPGAQDAVMAALRDPAPEVRQLALLTLWEASSPRSANAMHRALLDSDPGVRAQAEELLRRAPVNLSGE